MNCLLPGYRLARLALSIWFFFLSFMCVAQVPHPRDVFGFDPGDDHKLATYSQMLEYYDQLDDASDHVLVDTIGRSVLGEPLLLLYISSKENLQMLDRWQSISGQLARARIDESRAQALIQEGKSIVWIDGGLHATEVACAQMTTLLAHKVATEESPEMKHIRDNTILLLMPVMNPDGLDIVASWYDKNLETAFETTRPPWLYHHYVGHDNNRDWFMNNMPESKAVTQVLYNQWFPQIVYNHHQTGPSWSRIFIPPFADPVNPNIHPGVTTGVNIIGSAMANRFAMKEMPGAVSRVIYSMWWNGGMRTVPYFHNMIGILTETSHATPTPRYYDPDSLPKSIAARRGQGKPTDGSSVFYPYPWQGGLSVFKQPVNYMMSASMAVLRAAADQKNQWLENIYKMGKASIEKGTNEAPYVYIFPSGQWNAGEEINLLNILQRGGIEIHQVTQPFAYEGHTYQPGTHIIYAAQAFRPYLIDLLEKQTYPNRTRNGQPETPYDLAGWTLPMQMGVEVVRIDSLQEISSSPVNDPVRVQPGIVPSGKGNYVWSAHPNASILALNKMFNDGYTPHWVRSDTLDSDTFHVPNAFAVEVSSQKGSALLQDIAKSTGISFQSVKSHKRSTPLRKPKIGLYKSWVANMDEGWTRWLLEEYDFDTDTLHDQDIREADLSQYHCIILPHQSTSRMLHGHARNTMPAEYTGGLGLEGAEKLSGYVKSGGTIIALDAASDFAINIFGLPVRNTVSDLSSRQFFIPGSIVRLSINQKHVLSAGMPAEAGAAFVRSRAFEPILLSKKQEGGITQLPELPRPNVEVVAQYAEKDVLMSGWATGANQHLAGKSAMVRIPVENGEVILFGFRPQFRGQPRSTYKLFFNSIIASTLEPYPSNNTDNSESQGQKGK
ncbi:MAG: M14 family metallopeptidase [Saprospiraceae bacterium]|nr:M14 family metallopeptidase [Saprospiraceae bacterium]